MPPSDEADNLIREMRAVRHRLRHDATSAKQSIADKLDWRTYVRRAPVATTLLAAGLGYLLVPRSRNSTTNLAAWAARNERKRGGRGAVPTEEEAVQKAALLSSLLSVATAGVARAAAAYLANRVVGKFTAAPQEETRHVNRIRPFAGRPR